MLYNPQVENKVAEVRALGEKPVQIQTLGEAIAFFNSLVAKGVDPGTLVQLDDDFPTFVMKDFLSIERWSEDELIEGNLCTSASCK